MDFSRLTKRNIRALKPYQAEEVSCRVKLDANESPYCPAIQLPQTVMKRLNRYPDPDAKLLKKAIAKDLEIGPDNILLGNGSDELISYLIMTFGGPVLFPVPTFSMYAITAQALGEASVGVPLDNDFDLNTPKMLAAIRKYRPKLIFLASPNNPTGNCFSSDRMLKIIEASKGIVVVDEAYQAFSSEKGFLPLMKDYSNLAIMRTLSKTGFAALRTGFLVADRGLINEVNKVRLPFNSNALSQAIALGPFKNKKAVNTAIRAITSERERLFDALDAIDGVSPYPSEANFILFKVDNADRVSLELRSCGVLVRNLNPVLKGSLRVTVGTPGENKIFIGALKKILRRKG